MQTDLAADTQQRQAHVQLAHKGLTDLGLAGGAQDERGKLSGLFHPAHHLPAPNQSVLCVPAVHLPAVEAEQGASAMRRVTRPSAHQGALLQQIGQH